MQSDSATAPVSRKMRWAGYIVSALPAGGLVLSAAMKFIQPPEMADQMDKLGWSMDMALMLGILELSCVIIYLIPRTAVLGAILLTGFLGGAIATHVRIDDNFVAPIIVSVLAWLGLYLRDARIRALIPLRS